ncbi:MAG TPA: NAD(P)-dependent oxidoreductase [Cytophagales bacterium]|nr:NAD(P)-dependent oxidoreductase [Cytophagales bacterium]
MNEPVKIGLIREGKVPYDKRVALTPKQCKFLIEQYPYLSIYCQPSNFRSYPDNEFEENGTTVQEDLSDCDILFGIKEVPIDQLIEGKTYFFFSHTLKKQPYNRKLLQEVLKKNITLIDYEAITNEKKERLVAFGKYAGIVGAYNAFRTLGLKNNLFNLPPAYTLFDRNEMMARLKQCTFPPIKIVVTGSGRVAKGVKEILDELNIPQVSAGDFILKHHKNPVFTILRSSDYYQDEAGKFDADIFYSNPDGYKSTFLNFAFNADMLIAAAYWNPSAPKLFEKEDMKNPDFRIKIIADITCDINGSIPSTVKPSTIYDPFYDYNPLSGEIENAFSDINNITVMAIDNLPTELPRDASEFFGNQLIEHVFPALLVNDEHRVVQNSIIASGGTLSQNFVYLKDFVEHKE